jgi:hypothetical protein
VNSGGGPTEEKVTQCVWETVHFLFFYFFKSKTRTRRKFVKSYVVERFDQMLK